MSFITLDQKTKADLIEEAQAFATQCHRQAEIKACKTEIFRSLKQKGEFVSASAFGRQYIIDELKRIIADQYFDNKTKEINT